MIAATILPKKSYFVNTTMSIFDVTGVKIEKFVEIRSTKHK
jgi:hypothetical protein